MSDANWHEKLGRWLDSEAGRSADFYPLLSSEVACLFGEWEGAQARIAGLIEDLRISQDNYRLALDTLLAQSKPASQPPAWTVIA